MPGLDDVKVTKVDTFADAERCIQWLTDLGNGVLAIDTESHGLRPSEHPIRLGQLGDDQQAWVFECEGNRSWAGFFVKLLEKFTGTLVGHNLKFDERVIRKWLGIQLPLERCHDTMLMSRVVEPTRSAALKRLSSQLVDPRAAVLQSQLDDAMKTSGFNWSTVPLSFAQYWMYAGIDCILTRQVYDILHPRVMAEAPRAYELELAVSSVCGKMEDHGIRVDTSRAEQKHDELLKYVDELATYCQTYYSVHPGKNKDVIEYLTNRGITFTTLTKGGSIALDAEVLDGIDHPLANLVLQRRKAQKIASTYLRHFYQDVDEDDRLHPSVNFVAAETGRMSMSSPNMQNLPRTDTNELAQLVRSCVIPAPDHTLVFADFSQIEFRLFASLSENQDLIHAFDADDFFTEMARGIFNDPNIQKKDPRRQITKNAMYATIYGAGDKKFAWTAGISLSEAKEFMALLNLRFPAIKQLQRRITGEGERNLRETGTASVMGPLFGRRFSIDDDKIYKLVNFMVQGSAAQVLKLKLIQLAQAGLQEYLVIPVHDEVILEVPDGILHDVVHTVSGIMNDSTMFAVPLESEITVGNSWGAKRAYAR
jgi:DNA polymerase-1